MKSDQISNNSPGSRGGVLNWLVPAILIIGAVGMGVTGTLLWMESRPSTPGATNASVPSGAPMQNSESMSGTSGATIPQSAPGEAGSTPHAPPAELTAGMTPPQTALTLGNWYYDHEAWPQAVENYRRAIEQGIDNANVRTDYGSALRFSGQPKQALEQYLLAQKQDPSHQHSLFNQGGLYASDMKQPAKGIAIWREYLKRFPNGENVNAAKQLIAKTQAELNKN